MTKDDFKLLKGLSQNKNLIFVRPDKGKGVVLLNKLDYLKKMEDVLSDRTKFEKVKEQGIKIIYKIEDKVNRFLRELKNANIIAQKFFDDLYATGSNLGVLYGLPKVHKPDVPLRPILSACNQATFKLAKFVVPILSSLTNNRYTLLNSYQFADEITEQKSDMVLVSFDVASLFTNVPIYETIDIIMSKLFPDSTVLYHNFGMDFFFKLLHLVVSEGYFFFNGLVYKQLDGVAMGSPLGPTFANIFMNF